MPVTVALLAALLVVPSPAPAAIAPAVTPPAVVPAATGWWWPLAGTPAVVRGFDPPAARWLPGHRGVDLLGAPGAPVRAAGPGVVSFAGPVGGSLVVTVAHADGRRTTYQPVLAVVSAGDPVVAGTVLGGLSAAGSHCFPRACLHWGLLRGRTYLDPLALLGADPPVRLLPVWDDSGLGSSG